MSFLYAGRPRGGRSPRSCRIHRKQGASWNHGIIGTQRLQCKPSKITQNDGVVKVCFWTGIVVYFSIPKGDPGKTGEQGSAGVAGQRVSAPSMSNSHKNTTAVFVIVRTSVLVFLCSLLVVVGQLFILSLGSPWKRWGGRARWSTWPTCKCWFICIGMQFCLG